MRYATAGAFRTALEQRLANMSHETGAPIMRLRKLVVFDRLMARLMAVAPDRWFLKGAVAIHFRVGPRFRTTRDMDLGRQDSEEAATADFLSAQSVDLDDYFTFVVERTGQLDAATEGAAVRYHATAQLAGRTFEEVTVDVGFGDPVIGDPERLRGPDLLGFADIPPVEVPALPLGQHIAEKVHAYTRTYPSGNTNTRVKDLVDLAMISSFFGLQAGRLRRALETTFASRGTHPLPSALPPPPPEWRVAYQRMTAEVGLEPDMAVGYEQVKTFLDPILAGAVPDPILAGAVPDEAEWDSIKGVWEIEEY